MEGARLAKPWRKVLVASSVYIRQQGFYPEKKGNNNDIIPHLVPVVSISVFDKTVTIGARMRKELKPVCSSFSLNIWISIDFNSISAIFSSRMYTKTTMHDITNRV